MKKMGIAGIEENDAIKDSEKAKLLSNLQRRKELLLSREKDKELLKQQRLNQEEREKIKDTKYHIRYINFQLIKNIFSGKTYEKSTKNAFKK